MELIYEKISIKLRGLRAENSLSLDEVGKRLNLHRETIRRYENNPSIMSIDVLIKLLNLYKKDVNIFFNEIYGKLP